MKTKFVMKYFIVSLLLIGSVFIFAACEHLQPTVVNNPPQAPAFTDVQKIFTANCAFSGCHGAQNTQPAAKPQNLSAGSAYAAIVNVAAAQRPALSRVKSNDAANSYLVRKLEGGPDIASGRMPLGGSLTAAQIQTIKDWIADGAKNN